MTIKKVEPMVLHRDSTLSIENCSGRVNRETHLLLTLGLLMLTLLCGCTSSNTPCKTQLTPDWASRSELRNDIEQLTSPALEGSKTGTRGAELSREYISQRFSQIGLTSWEQPPGDGDKPGYSHPFNYDYQFGRREGVNLVGVLKSPTPNDRWRIVVAHYDHLGKKAGKVHPGADDNASGVAAMLQLAAHSASEGEDGEQINYMFVATDAEEPGLFGGYALAEKLNDPNSNPNSKQIELAINMDMIGRPGRPYAIYLEGRRGFKHFKLIQQRLSNETGLCIKANHPRNRGREVSRVDWLRASDHYPLHRVGIPWLYFGVPPHKDYHAPTDTSEKIDLNFLAAVTESAYQLLIINSLLLQNAQ
ncbi:M28 family peptidase [uncultured Shewanella sp.]|uniref:M28 family peptidase n=1 Tax=uncultured Shewanella sp. TaxID=173975 RepID=UPI002617CCC6|nr:M28 family peptidase [uncultured Shewanella sp.]